MSHLMRSCFLQFLFLAFTLPVFADDVADQVESDQVQAPSEEVLDFSKTDVVEDHGLSASPDQDGDDFEPKKQNARAESKVEKANKDLKKVRSSITVVNTRSSAASRQLAKTTKELDRVLRQIKTEKQREKKLLKQAKDIDSKHEKVKARLATARHDLAKLKKKNANQEKKLAAKLPQYRGSKRSDNSQRDLASRNRN